MTEPPGLPTLVARFCAVPADRITADTRFDRLGGWGSLAALQLLAVLEREYGVELDLEQYMRIPTIGELAEHVQAHRADGPGR